MEKSDCGHILFGWKSIQRLPTPAALLMLNMSPAPHDNTDLSISLTSAGHHAARWVQGW